MGEGYSLLCAFINEGADMICNDELWEDTSKAAGGHLAQVLLAKAK